MSPLARNWFFGAYYFGYNTSPNSLYMRYLFKGLESGAELRQELVWTLATAILTTLLGLAAGNWMRRIRR
jgi:hypothetical protein